MARIQVSPERRYECLELERLWAANLPRDPGQLGGPITSSVEGPSGVFSLLTQEFIDFLRNRKFPFQEV